MTEFPPGSHHQPIVIDRVDWRIIKVEYSCGATLELGSDSGSPKEQANKQGALFRKHKKEIEFGRKKPVEAAKPKLAKRPKHEDFSQAAVRIVREATER
jgi:hypothetical protein